MIASRSISSEPRVARSASRLEGSCFSTGFLQAAHRLSTGYQQWPFNRRCAASSLNATHPVTASCCANAAVTVLLGRFLDGRLCGSGLGRRLAFATLALD